MRKAAVIVVGLTAILTGVAQAAIPRDPEYMSRQLEAQVNVDGFGTNRPAFEGVDNFGHKYHYCGTLWWDLTTPVRIKSGYFSYSGTVEVAVPTSRFPSGQGEARRFRFWGHFVTPDKMKGVFQIVGCAKRTFVATG